MGMLSSIPITSQSPAKAPTAPARRLPDTRDSLREDTRLRGSQDLQDARRDSGQALDVAEPSGLWAERE